MGVSGLGGLPVSTTTQQQQLPSLLSLLAADKPADEMAPAAAAAAAKLDMEQPMPVVAMGLANGTVQVLDGHQMAAIGMSLPTSSSPSTALLQVREGTPTPRGSSFPPVVDVCFDATGTCLAALDRGGMCCIWEYKLEFVRRQPSHPQGASSALATTTLATTPTSNTITTSSVFTSFMLALTGSTTVAPTATTASTATSGTGTTPASAPTAGGLGFWRLSAVQAVCISYPSTFGGATVLALDPAYKLCRKKAVLVGFANGCLILTKRGMLFQCRVDNVLYQEAATTASTTVTTHNNNKTTKTKQEDTAVMVSGIQALTWRGSLVAWADATGVCLLDANQLLRIAHIDPPVGARPFLYAHQLVGMKPHLCFETSHKLLVAWGDCLLQLQLQLRKEQQQAAHPLPAKAQSTTAAAPPLQQQQQAELDSSNNTNSKNPPPPATGKPIQTTSSAAPASHGPPLPLLQLRQPLITPTTAVATTISAIIGPNTAKYLNQDVSSPALRSSTSMANNESSLSYSQRADSASFPTNIGLPLLMVNFQRGLHNYHSLMCIVQFCTLLGSAKFAEVPACSLATTTTRPLGR